MSLKEKFTNPAKVAICDSLLDEIEKYGLGSMLKSDQDALFYHLLARFINPGVIKSRHDWIRLLRVKPGRLNGIQETASVKFDKLEDTPSNWLKVNLQLERHYPEVKDKNSGTVVIYIDDAHVYRFLEWYLNMNGSSPEYEINRTRLVIKYTMYLTFLEKITNDVGLDISKLEKQLKEDKSAGKIKKTYNSASDLLKDLKEKMKETTIREGTKELLEYAGTAIIGFAKKQIGED